jgi:hypothetical protein
MLYRIGFDNFGAIRSSHRVVPYIHDALATDRTAARASSAATLDVVRAVRRAAPLQQS